MQLVGTTDKIELSRSSTANVDVVAEYVDATGVSPPVVQGDTTGTQLSTFNTAATGEIVAAAASGELRRINEITITNRHATLSVDVSVIHDRSGTDYRIIGPVTLRPGESLHYIKGMGWLPIYTPLNPAIRTVVLTADKSETSVTPSEATGLSITTGVGKYVFQHKLIVTAATAGTGPPRFSINHTGTLTEINYWVYSVSATTTASDGLIDGDVSLATGGLINVNAARTKSTAGLAPFTSHDATTQIMYIIDGIFVCSVDGDLELWHGSETAAVASVIKAGSSLVLIRTGD